jgi:hypothetical protein
VEKSNDRVIVVEVKPSGNANIDGISVDQKDIKKHLRNLKQVGFHKFNVKPYCGLVSSQQLEIVRMYVTSLG